MQFNHFDVFFVGKAKRIKQAREEAQAEIEKYRQERERQFREYEVKYMGSRDDVQAKIDKNTEIHTAKIIEEVDNNKEKVPNQKAKLYLA